MLRHRDAERPYLSVAHSRVESYRKLGSLPASPQVSGVMTRVSDKTPCRPCSVLPQVDGTQRRGCHTGRTKQASVGTWCRHGPALGLEGG